MKLTLILLGTIFVFFTSLRPAQGRTERRVSEIVPVILVPGWGFDYAPAVFGQEVFRNYREWLLQSGFRHVHTVRYSYMEDLPTIEREIGMQLREILRLYPSRTRFDMMGHSLGGFVGLYAMLRSGLGSRLRKFVSLSGIPLGWNSALCADGLCGKAHVHLIPFRSPFVMEFHRRYRGVLAGVEKCSLYSRADEFIRPFDAAKFSDGTNVEVPNMRHMDIVLKYDCFRRMLRSCYGR